MTVVIKCTDKLAKLIDSRCLEKIELFIGFRTKLFASNNFG
ncbi:hypothetical protein HMPREF9532_01318 [Escherichia coli MS 57-2]|nr:hypothetical protein HMPREF9532_01318 [Escherichia coli MS 57-2]ESD41451.1 hypothetical protein HMPREF1604_02316 [Escherichia coli 908519]